LPARFLPGGCDGQQLDEEVGGVVIAGATGAHAAAQNNLSFEKSFSDSSTHYYKTISVQKTSFKYHLTNTQLLFLHYMYRAFCHV
jgi:hypothetical protein